MGASTGDTTINHDLILKEDLTVGVDTNDKGQRVIEIVWHVERKAMLVTLAGVETIYGIHK